MTRNRVIMGTCSLLFAISLSACSTDSETSEEQADIATETKKTAEQNSAHTHMNHSSSGEVPDELQESQDPAFEVGSQAIIETDHMEGMNGAEATIAGAYDTTVYFITFTPHGGGEPVEDHKWVIHEELEAPGSEPLEVGDEVTLTADHMGGMNGASATIDSAENTTVYMIDFVTVTDGDKVTNHKWVTEDELTSK